jgi:hypothetical protein
MTARKVHPQGDFRIQDILQDTIKEQWDYVVLSGVFNIIPEGFNRRTQWQFIQAMLAKMMGLAKKGIAADFQSTYVDFQAQNAFHVDPCEVFRFGKTLSRRVVVRHDYMPYEFAVYVYKDDKITLNNVFSDFAQYVDWYTENEFYGNFAVSSR